MAPHLGLANKYNAKKLRYVEDKQADMGLVSELLAKSSKANHWSNFGPVSLQLEEEIAEFINLRQDLCVVACSSGTAAMHAVIALQETLAGRNLRWLTSAYGFYSSIQGPLSKTQVSDCDNRTMLDLSNLPNMASFDGLVVTNTFGQERNLQNYYQFASEHNKVLCIDSALALDSAQHGPNECISFHHTKPWGFGEGGCAIVEKQHEKLFRSLISFGHDSPEDDINRYASNGKMSDIAAAFCLSRLRQMKELKPRYQEQYHRIAQTGLQLGYEIVGDTTTHPGTPSNVPLLAPFDLSDVRHTILPTGKYYFPLGKTPTATDIYHRIVNVPCHIGMEKLSNRTLARALEDIATLNTALDTSSQSPLT